MTYNLTLEAFINLVYNSAKPIFRTEAREENVMARADLVVNLVESGINGDIRRFRSTAEAIAEDANTKHQHHLAQKVLNALNTGESAPSMVNASDLNGILYELLTSKTFDDLVLPKNIQSLCSEIIEEHSRRDILRSYGLEPRHKILLSGPPGNGKPSLAEALANHLMVPFINIKYEGIISKFLGESAQHLDNAFEFVKTKRCVVFFDEFDAISKERSDDNDNGEIKRVVNSLLKQIDNLPSHVVVVAATNHETMLDKAVWRRFQLHLTLPKPTPSMTEGWLKAFEERCDFSFGYQPKTIANKLKVDNFSDLEQFALDVRRKFVLGLPESEKKIKSIVDKCIAHWA